jgi:pimeloyl-ACP methyl ester carboxylesterase
MQDLTPYFLLAGQLHNARPDPVFFMEEHLVHADRVRSIVIPEATHYVHLDRPERGRDKFIQEVLSFLN